MYSVRHVADKVGMTVQGVYALRRRMKDSGMDIGTPIGVFVGTGEVVLYSDADIEAIQVYRQAHPPKEKGKVWGKHGPYGPRNPKEQPAT